MCVWIYSFVVETKNKLRTFVCSYFYVNDIFIIDITCTRQIKKKKIILSMYSVCALFAIERGSKQIHHRNSEWKYFTFRVYFSCDSGQLNLSSFKRFFDILFTKNRTNFLLLFSILKYISCLSLVQVLVVSSLYFYKTIFFSFFTSVLWVL